MLVFGHRPASASATRAILAHKGGLEQEPTWIVGWVVTVGVDNARPLPHAHPAPTILIPGALATIGTPPLQLSSLVVGFDVGNITGDFQGSRRGRHKRKEKRSEVELHRYLILFFTFCEICGDGSLTRKNEGKKMSVQFV